MDPLEQCCTKATHHAQELLLSFETAALVEDEVGLAYPDCLDHLAFSACVGLGVASGEVGLYSGHLRIPSTLLEIYIFL